MHGAELKAAAKAGQRLYGTCITSPSPHYVEPVCGTGIDFVFIDTEHIPLGRETLSWMCRAYSARGVAPIVRIPSPDPYAACIALDGGAEGVIAPYVELPEDVRKLVGAAKFRPLKGERLRRYLDGDEKLEPELLAYLEERNANTVLWVNIESVPAMDRLDEILAVAGLDGVLLGPHDLSCSLGLPEKYDEPVFLETLSELAGKARAAGLMAAAHYTRPDEEAAVDWAKRGFNCIILNSDVQFTSLMLSRRLKSVKDVLGDAHGADDGADVTI